MKIKKEMKMMPNGNYEEVVSWIQHSCKKDINWECYQYGRDGKLILHYETGGPYEVGYEDEVEIKFCPFCGYSKE